MLFLTSCNNPNQVETLFAQRKFLLREYLNADIARLGTHVLLSYKKDGLSNTFRFEWQEGKYVLENMNINFDLRLRKDFESLDTLKSSLKSFAEELITTKLRQLEELGIDRVSLDLAPKGIDVQFYLKPNGRLKHVLAYVSDIKSISTDDWNMHLKGAIQLDANWYYKEKLDNP